MQASRLGLYEETVLDYSQEKSVNNTVNMRRLKIFAKTKLSMNKALREVLLAEDDEITIEEFLVQIKLWLRLLERSRR